MCLDMWLDLDMCLDMWLDMCSDAAKAVGASMFLEYLDGFGRFEFAVA